MERRRFFASGLGTIEGYEYREQQRRMADLVYQVLTHGHIGLIEAGTGTGKSLAYLYPAVCYARATGKDCSFNQHNQPAGTAAGEGHHPEKTGLQIQAVVVKGWNNYPLAAA